MTPAAESRFRSSPSLQQKSTTDAYLMECKYVGIGDPPIIFPGPWLSICGYLPSTGPLAKKYILFSKNIFIPDDLFSKLLHHVVDEKTMWDPISGTSHSGLYLRNA